MSERDETAPARGVADGWRLAADGDPCSLQDCPPGPFLFNGSLGFKTEYGASKGKDIGGGKVEWEITHWADPYCLESGEVFWAGAKGHEARSALIVQPLSIATAPSSPAATLYRDGVSVEAAPAVDTKITRADRNAAYSYFNLAWFEEYGVDADDRPFISGALDHEPLVQAFYRHRLAPVSSPAATPEVEREVIADIIAAKVSGPQGMSDFVRGLHRLDQLTAADAILALSTPPAPTGERI